MEVASGEIITISKVKREPAYSMKHTHHHECHELFYLISGECNMFVNHNIYKMSPGDIILIPAHEIHKTKYLEKGTHERVIIGFENETMSWIEEMLGAEEVQKYIKQFVLSIPDKRRDYVEGLIAKLLFESDHPDILAYTYIKLLFQELILFIIRCYEYGENVIKEIDVDNKLMQEIATYIYNNYDKNIYLDEVAGKFNISRSYLSKKFKAVTGFGFKEYLINVRIKEACRLLLETNKSITDIAFLCGFNDSNYFGDAFRSIKGMSPNKYRKSKETI